MDITGMDSLHQGSLLSNVTALGTRDGDDGGSSLSYEPGSSVVDELTRALLARRRPSVLRSGGLAGAVSADILPRLVLALRAPNPGSAKSVGNASFAEPILVLAALALENDVAGAVRLVEALQGEGHALDTIYIDVVSAAARHLGQLWHDDRASFADVTIGVLALQRLLHALDHAFCCNAEPVRRDPGKRILLSTRPGEAHGFALDIVGAFLRRAGWMVETIAPKSKGELSVAIRQGWYAVLGISDSCGDSRDALASAIHAARRASLNRDVRVMVGGPAFAVDPDRVTRTGADVMARDARHAVEQAEGLLAHAR